MTHTPGPWHIQAEFDHEPAYIMPPSNCMNADLEIAQVMPDHRSNARLIAAAPDLLAALDEIQRMVESTYCTPDAMDDPIWQCARAAIAKATGE